MFQRVACQVSPFCDWARERKLPTLPLICFETGRRTQTQSCWAARQAAPANGCLVLFANRNRGREANTRAEHRKEFTPRSSRAPQENFLLLDTDLSWMSAYRKVEKSTWTVSAFTRRSLMGHMA